MNPPSSFAIDLPESVLRRARGGDLQAFEQVYRLFEKPAFALAFRLLGDREEAHDTVHDALLKVFRNLAGFRGDSPFWGWVRQITANEALMRLRKRELLCFVDELPEPDADHGSALLPSQMAEQGLLQRAMDGLPPTTRAVLWMYHAEGFTHDEIGRLMGRTVSFSKSQLARGTRRLRELLRLVPEETSHV